MKYFTMFPKVNRKDKIFISVLVIIILALLGSAYMKYRPSSNVNYDMKLAENSAIEMAADMGIEILSEQQYRALQELGHFDTKTSSWIITPADIRKRGGALFADYRYGYVFVYHNGAESYYAGRAFRGALRV